MPCKKPSAVKAWSKAKIEIHNKYYNPKPSAFYVVVSASNFIGVLQVLPPPLSKIFEHISANSKAS
jgi:hypothetical protein